jgi:hypothetical protein
VRLVEESNDHIGNRSRDLPACSKASSQKHVTIPLVNLADIIRKDSPLQSAGYITS